MGMHSPYAPSWAQAPDSLRELQNCDGSPELREAGFGTAALCPLPEVHLPWRRDGREVSS
jgi:hypothetical protein